MASGRTCAIKHGHDPFTIFNDTLVDDYAYTDDYTYANDHLTNDRLTTRYLIRTY